MIIGIISDVHGNLPALEAALVDARRRGAEQFIGLGDWIGYGPFPGEVIDSVRDAEAAGTMRCIRGNYDVKVLNARRDPDRYRKKLKPNKWEVLDWTRTHITDDQAEWLRSLPDSLTVDTVSGCSLQAHHGSPEGNEGRIYPSITRRALGSMIQGSLPEIMVVGHTHVPFVKRIDGCLLINAGSAGQPVDGDPRPMYALIDIVEKKPPGAEIIRFEYPVDAVLKALKVSGLPQWLIRDFKTGKKRK